ncbi:MAG: hypothetical protein RRB13_02945 [bacterium]|nr:hypothetical protein [bacterium]
MFALILSLLLGLAGFYLEAWPRFKNRYFGIDTWRFALLADQIRRHHRLPLSVPERYIVPGSVDNPPFLYWLLSLFPKSFVDRHQGLFSPAFDVLHGLTLFAAGWYISGTPWVGLLAQAIYLVTPVTPLEASNLSLRTFSSLIVTWTMLGLMAYLVDPAPWKAGLAIGLVCLVAYTHRMSLQVIFFTFFTLTLFDGERTYLLIFLPGVALAIFGFKAKYLEYLRGQLLLVAFWMYNIHNRLAHMTRGLPSRKAMPVDFVRKIEFFIQKIPILPLFAVNPWLTFVLWRFYEQPELVQPHFVASWSPLLIKWALALFFLSWLFNLRYLRFLGEGQRYLEYAGSAVALIAAQLVYRSLTGLSPLWIAPLAGLGALACVVLVVLMQYKLVVNNPDKSITEPLWRIIEHMKAQNNPRIACIPHGLSDAFAYFMENGQTLLSDNSVGVYELVDFWPLMQKTPDQLAAKYGLTHLLLSTGYAQPDELDLSNWRLERQEGQYLLFVKT